MKQKVLITGASGFVGKHLVREAHKKGYTVHAAVRPSSQVEPIQDFVEDYKYLDYEDISAMQGLFKTEKYAYIIHAAALTTAKSEAAMHKVNVEYTLNLIEAAFYAGNTLERFVYVSSLAAVGPVLLEEPTITEDNALQPITMYGRSKKKSEEEINKKFSDKAITILRPTAVYGPYEKDIFILFQTMAKGLDPYIGKQKQVLSFVYVADLVEALLSACRPAKEALEIYNISDGNAYSRYAMADIYKMFFDKKLFRMHVPTFLVRQVAVIMQALYQKSKKTPVLYPERIRELTAQNWACDISRAKEKLGFSPKYNLEKGLSETLKWYKENNWL